MKNPALLNERERHKKPGNITIIKIDNKTAQISRKVNSFKFTVFVNFCIFNAIHKTTAFQKNTLPQGKVNMTISSTTPWGYTIKNILQSCRRHSTVFKDLFVSYILPLIYYIVKKFKLKNEL